MAGPRNRKGYNDTADCYRTINGERYIGWLINPSVERIKAYRAAGLKCRKLKDELFLREEDQAEASKIDKK